MAEWPIWAAAAALLMGGVLATVQQALASVGRVPLERLAERRGSPDQRRRVGAILDDLEGHLTSVALPRIALNLAGVALFVLGIRDLRGAESAGAVDLLVGVPLAALATWIVSVVVPLSIAEHAPERAVFAATRFLRAWRVLTAPLMPVFRVSNEIIRRLLGAERRSVGDDLEEELRSVVEAGEREGQIDESERAMIEAVVELRDTTVEQIMTPRTELNAIAYTDDLEELKRLVEPIGHSRIPVYRDSLDRIEGILYVKDLLRRLIAPGGEPAEPETSAFVLTDLLRSATFVPETKTVRELLAELLAAKVHIAIVADEYGGTSGVVTIEDIVEEIFGEIQDEYEPDDDRGDTVDLDPERRAAAVDARLEIDDANDRLGSIGVAFPESEDYDTVGGFVVVTLGRIPDAGERFTHRPDEPDPSSRNGTPSDAFEVEVLEAEPTRVKRIAVRVVEAEDGSGASRGRSADAIGRDAGAGERAGASGPAAESGSDRSAASGSAEPGGSATVEAAPDRRADAAHPARADLPA